MRYSTGYSMITGEVAKRLNVSVVRVRQLDNELEPIRVGGNMRLYNPAVVEKVALERAAKRRG